ncbi:cupin domain-containing protein [Streptomyces sp. NPDC001941]|uniref:cupin domain-containing protein n=1 Tax=Streptomyces sp. NPDC001941 TaxID=3154659 RepID=UPI00332B983D
MATNEQTTAGNDPAHTDELTVLQTATPPDIPDGVDVTTVLLQFPPGHPGNPPHRHPGPVFGYMLEGEMLFEVEGQAPYVVRAGDAFWEPGRDVIHYQALNVSPDSWCRFVVTMVCPPGAPLLTPVDDDELARRRHLRVPGDASI